jgi:hypothetical protein
MARSFNLRWVAYPGALIACILLPAACWRLGLLVPGDAYRQLPDVFAVFAVSASAAMAVAAWFELGKQPRPLSPERAVTIVCGFLTGFYFLAIVSSGNARAGDYACYENAARALLAGRNAYGGCYLYPPPMAQVMAHLHEGLAWAAAATGASVPGDSIWDGIYFLYQCAQFALVCAAFVLCYRFARIAGLNRAGAAVATTFLLVLNGPMLRTLEERQVNLWVLDLIVFGLIAASRYPFVSGWAISLGTLIKLYPAALIVPALLGRVSRIVVGFAAGLVVTAALLAWGGGWRAWFEYAAAAASFPQQALPRNLSINGFFAQVVQIGSAAGLARSAVVHVSVSILQLALKAALGVWFAIRFFRREKRYRAGAVDETARLFENALDILALTLLVSPVLWDHHLVLTAPIALWAWAKQGRARPLHTGVAIFLTLGQYTTLFPLYFLRPIGLMIVCALMARETGVDPADASTTESHRSEQVHSG